MSPEIRFYNKSIEQAKGYVAQHFLRGFGSNPDVRYVRMKPLRSNQRYATPLARALSVTTPSVFCTVVHNDVEYPVLAVDLSTHVFTKDHELQAYPARVAARKSDACYARIAPTGKDSRFGHGGDTNYEFVDAYATDYQQGGCPVHLEWPLEKDDSVATHDRWLSCPPETPEIVSFLEQVGASVGNQLESLGSNPPSDLVEAALRDSNEFEQWFDELAAYDVGNDVSTLNSSRTTWVDEGLGYLQLKVNRFAHAMDPERGMLWYYHDVVGDAIEVIWTGEQVNGNRCRPTLENLLERSKINKYGIFDSFLDESGQRGKTVIDVTEFVEDNLSRLNKALQSIFINARALEARENEKMQVRFEWDSTFSIDSLDLSNNPNVSEVSAITKPSEDYASYFVATQFLPQYSDILGVSYPGAQGDLRILYTPEEGRSRKRDYIDIIAQADDHLLLVECADAYRSNKFESDQSKLLKYKEDGPAREALFETLRKVGVQNPGEKKIEFGMALFSSESINPAGLDFLVRLEWGESRWYLEGTSEVLTDSKGILDVPAVDVIDS